MSPIPSPSLTQKHFLKPRRSPDRRHARYYQPRLDLLEDRVTPSVTLTGVPTWIEQGPGPEQSPFYGTVSGAVQCIAQDPGTDTQSLNTVYIGAVNGGVWKTTNALLASDPTTVHWTPLTDQFPSLSIGSIAVSPVNHNVVFAGIGHGSSGEFSDLQSPLTGLLRSLDGGTSWTQIGPRTIDPSGTLGAFSIFHILPLPAAPGTLWNHETILLSARGSINSGLFVTHDGGDTWTLVSGPSLPIHFGYVSDLKVDPANVGGAYAAVGGQGIFHSIGGDTWSSSLVSGASIIRLAVHSSNRNVYAILATPAYSILVTTSNSTGPWTTVTGTPPKTVDQTQTLQFGIGVQEGSFLVDNNNVLYLAGTSARAIGQAWVFRGTINNGTVSWVSLQQGSGAPTSTHPDGRDLEFDSAGNLLFSNDGGINRLRNPGVSNTPWESLNTNLGNLEFYTVAYDSLHGTIAGGAQDNGVPVQLGPGNLTWQDEGFIGDGGLVTVNGSALDRNFYGSSDGTGMTRYQYNADQKQFNAIQVSFSENNDPNDPAHPKIFTNGLTDIKGQPFAFNRLDNAGAASYRMVIQLTYHPFQSDQAIYLYESDSFLSGFTPLNAIALNRLNTMPMPAPIYQSFSVPDRPVNLPPNADQENGSCPIVYGGMLNGVNFPDVLWIGTVNQAGQQHGQVLFRESGSTMPQPLAAYQGGPVRAIAVDASNYQRAAVLDTSGHVYYTFNKGASFVDVTGNLLAGTDLTNGLSPADLHPDTIEVIGSGSNVAILVGGQDGVYRLIAPSTSSTTWSEFGEGLPNVIVTDLHYAPVNTLTGKGNVLLAGTFGRGAWIIPNVTSQVFNPGMLQISGDTDVPGETDHFLLRRNASNPLLLDVIDNFTQFLDNDDPARPNQPFERSTIRFIDVDGQGGSNTLGIDDTFNAAATTYTLSSAVLTATSAGFNELTVSYRNLQGLSLSTGSGSDVFNVFGTAAAAPVTLTGSAGNDVFNVTANSSALTINSAARSTNTLVLGSQIAGLLSSIQAPVSFHGQGSDKVVLNDSGNTTTLDSATLTATSATTRFITSYFNGSPVITLFAVNVSYSGVNNVTFNASSASITDASQIHGDSISVTPQSGILFIINGRSPVGAAPGDGLTLIAANGIVSFFPSTTAGSGYYTFASNTATPIVQYTGIENPNPAGWLVVAADAGGSPDVQVFQAQSGTRQFDLVPFGSSFQGGIRVAAGDINGDGIPDIITAQGPGGNGLIGVFDGITGQPLAGPLGIIQPFGPGYHGGVFVAVGDVNRDAYGDLVVGEDAGGQPRVKVYSGKDGSVLADFLAFGAGFGGGVRVAAANVNSSGGADVVAAAGPGGAPQIKVFEGSDLTKGITTPTLSFNAFDATFTGGVYVGTGDVHGDGIAKILAGEGAGDQPRVRVFDGSTGSLLHDFLAFEPGFRGGVRVAAADVNGDGRSDIVAGQGPGGLPLVRAFDGLSLKQVDNIFGFDASFRGGVFVGGGGRWGIVHDITQHGEGRVHVLAQTTTSEAAIVAAEAARSQATVAATSVPRASSVSSATPPIIHIVPDSASLASRSVGTETEPVFPVMNPSELDAIFADPLLLDGLIAVNPIR
jgi:hypothetical protein